MNARLRLDILRANVAEMDARVDALLRFELRDRYVAQSAATTAGSVAAYPAERRKAVGGVFRKVFRDRA